MLARGDEFGERAERESNLRRGVAAEALREFLPDWRWTMPQGGLSFWVLLPDGDAVAFSRVAAEHGVLVRSGPAASPQGGFRDHLRIAVGEEPERLREGIRRLADAWQECSPSAEPADGLRAVGQRLRIGATDKRITVLGDGVA